MRITAHRERFVLPEFAQAVAGGVEVGGNRREDRDSRKPVRRKVVRQRVWECQSSVGIDENGHAIGGEGEIHVLPDGPSQEAGTAAELPVGAADGGGPDAGTPGDAPQRAFDAIDQDHSVLVAAPTGSGTAPTIGMVRVAAARAPTRLPRKA